MEEDRYFVVIIIGGRGGAHSSVSVTYLYNSNE
jgi:RNase adaptor protein for sRNA GlmZ degradation